MSHGWLNDVSRIFTDVVRVYKDFSRVFQENSKVSKGFQGCLSLIFSEYVMNKLKYMNCNAKGLCMTFIMLMTMSKIHALLQKVLEDWLRLPERQELFAGLLISTAFQNY